MPFRTLAYQMNVLASFAPDKLVRKLVGSSESVEIEVICLDTGQFIPIHRADSNMVFLIWEGRADFYMGDQVNQVATGHVITVPAGQKRGVQARTKVIAFVIHSPPLDESLWEAINKAIDEGNFELNQND